MNANLATNYSGLTGFGRSVPNGLPQVGPFDVDAYNTNLLLNQSLANASSQPYTNAQSGGYPSTHSITAFQSPYNIYDTSNSFWF